MSIKIPIINISALISNNDGKQSVVNQIGRACREFGFFYVTGHGVDHTLCERIETLGRQFFALPLREKRKVSKTDDTWRGYFAIGEERVTGKGEICMNEGIYFGPELQLSQTDSSSPYHSQNLYPNIDGFRATVLAYLAAMIELGHAIMRGIALSLDLEENYFADRYTGRDPTVLTLMLNYVPVRAFADGIDVDNCWGIGEHTDYGLLTMLRQDNVGGLQVKCKSQWIEATPLEGSFICNIGDMLDRMTGGLYRSTPHRVRCPQSEYRFSIPVFFEPNLDSIVTPIECIGQVINDDKNNRWDKTSVHEISGTYGEYLANKMNKAFSYKPDN